MSPRPVLIEWIDAFGDGVDWTDISDLETEQRVIRTFGFLLEPRVDGYHTVASSYDKATKHVTGVIHIPHTNVLKLKRIKT